MVEPITIEGTWEEIAARADEFAGRRVRLTIVPGNASETDGDAPKRSIEEKIQDRAAQVPDEEWNNLPPDLLDRLDHYLYGTPDK